MNNVFITIKKELRTILRDKKSLMMMLITPIMIPLFIFIFSYVYDKLMNTNENEKYYVGINYNLNDIEKNLINENLEIKYYENKDDMSILFTESMFVPCPKYVCQKPADSGCGRYCTELKIFE